MHNLYQNYPSSVLFTSISFSFKCYNNFMKKKKALLILPILLPLLMANSPSPDQGYTTTYEQVVQDFTVENNILTFECDNNSNYFLRGFEISDSDNNLITGNRYDFYGYFIPPYKSAKISLELEEYNVQDVIESDELIVTHYCYDYSQPESFISYFSYSFLSYNAETNITIIDIDFDFVDLDNFALNTVLFYFYDPSLDSYVYGETWFDNSRFDDDTGNYQKTIQIPGNYENINNYSLNYLFTIRNDSYGFGLTLALFGILGGIVFIGISLIVLTIFLIRLIVKTSKIK